MFPYDLSQNEKCRHLLNQLNDLTSHHRSRCIEYQRIGQALDWNVEAADIIEEVPYLPVGLFKHKRLMSIPSEEVHKILLSSGTSSAKRSEVVLDVPTAQRQATALMHIMRELLGAQRLPMLILDHKIASQADELSARQAGTLGMSLFGHSYAYAMDMNDAQLTDWVRAHATEPVFLFGFTHLVWEFLQRLNSEELSLPKGILVHGGGWKKLQDQSVGEAQFQQELRQKLGIIRCHNYYGMVEQVGSIFMGCQFGRLHCPIFAEVLFRNPQTWKSRDEGLIQVLSVLPTSYPGHSLLTEDLGKLLGIDDCPCGRKGKTFQVLGRAPKAEVRGCSNV